MTNRMTIPARLQIGRTGCIQIHRAHLIVELDQHMKPGRRLYELNQVGREHDIHAAVRQAEGAVVHERMASVHFGIDLVEHFFGPRLEGDIAAAQWDNLFYPPSPHTAQVHGTHAGLLRRCVEVRCCCKYRDENRHSKILAGGTSFLYSPSLHRSSLITKVWSD